MPYMYSEMQNKLSKTRDSPLESMGQIISSRCPIARRCPPWLQDGRQDSNMTAATSDFPGDAFGVTSEGELTP